MNMTFQRAFSQIPTDIYKVEYPKIEEFTETQLKKMWFPKETAPEKDIHDILTNTSKKEKHGIFTVLKLFTKYESVIGNEYWSGRFKQIFGRHEFVRMGATFAMMELAVHMVFYNEINLLLNAHDDSFYTEWKDDPVLSERMSFIDSLIDHENDLISLAGITLVEGCILYSSFAFLLHFQKNGMNKIPNVVRGIDFSSQDENLHAEAGAYCYRLLQSELQISDEERLKNEELIYQAVRQVIEHEDAITDKIFAYGDLESISSSEVKIFNRNRADQCLINLGMKPLFGGVQSEINKWFYNSINTYIQNDFFVGKGREYVRQWNKTGFVW